MMKVGGYRNSWWWIGLFLVVVCWMNSSSSNNWKKNGRPQTTPSFIVYAQQQEEEREEERKEQEYYYFDDDESSLSLWASLPKAPKHLGDGLVQGCTIVVTGMLSGLALSVSIPILSWKSGQQSIPEIVWSIVLGGLGGVLMTSGSILVALMQQVRSILPTYYALRSGYDGTLYINGTWTTHSLHQLSSASSGSHYYYNLLEVTPDATIADIKRAYRHKARSTHPDKLNSPEAILQFQQLTQAYQALIDPSQRHALLHHPNTNNNTNNTAQVLDILLLTQLILGLYHQPGLQSYIGGNVRLAIDISLLMQLLTDKVVPYNNNNNNNAKNPETILSPKDIQTFLQKRSQIQQKRMYDIATFLRSKISHANDDWNTYIQFLQDDIQQYIISSSSSSNNDDYAVPIFLPTYLYEIGTAIHMEANEFLAFQSYSPNKAWMAIKLPFQLFLQGPLTKLSSLLTYQIPRQLSSSFNLFQSIKTILFQKTPPTITTTNNNNNDDSLWDLLVKKNYQNSSNSNSSSSSRQSQEEQIAQLMLRQMSNVIPSIMEIVWKIIQRDINDTLRQSTQYLIQDAELSYAERVQRAKALQGLGRELIRQSHLLKNKKNKNAIHDYFWNHTDFSARFQVAFTLSVQKAKMNDPSIIPTASEREEQIQQIIQENEKNNIPPYHYSDFS